jgi:tetratricopeptide (TPR) repeat protein
MKPPNALFALLLVAALTTGGAAMAQTGQPPPDKEAVRSGEAGDVKERFPNVELTPRLLFGFLLAEIAGQRGQFADAATLYLDLAKETRDPRVARRAAEVAMHSRQHDAALQAARLWLEIDPDSMLARQAVIGLLSAVGRYDELKAMLPAILASEPHALPRNLLHVNRLFARGGDRQKVREIVDAVTEPYANLPEAHYARAQAAAEARELPAALVAINRALALKPDWEGAALFRAQLTEDRNEAAMALGLFVAANPQAHDARLAYARALAGAKRYGDARREFRQLLDISAADPAKSGDIVFAVAVLSMQLNDTQDAEKHLLRLIEVGHGEADKARYFLGQIAEEGKRWDEALKWFNAVGRGEQYLTARMHAAAMLAKRGQLDAARAHLRATETKGASEQAQLLVGEAQLLRDAGRPADAHAVLTDALAQQPDQPELLYDIALLAEKLGRIDELEMRLRRLLEIKPDHAHALNALGYSLAERNIRLDEARTLIERAVELAPNDPFILDSKGWLLFRQGDLPGALDFLKRAFGIRADPEIAAHVGEVLWSLGRQDEARQTWDKARKDFPENETLVETIKRLVR